MQYLTELHAHTATVSPCADLEPEEVAERYIEAGYTTIVVTDHYCNYVLDPAGDSWEEKIRHYVSGYKKMKDYAKDRLQVLLGCELRFTNNHNDYLVYGMDEEFLLAHPDLHLMKPRSFSELARANGLLFVQAHPFRDGMTVTNPKYLDGIEAFNGHKGHDSRNTIAELWSRRFGLLRTSGSDFHHPDSETSGGIITDVPVTSMTQLIEILRSGSCTLRCSGTAAQREGMTDMPAKY